MTPVYYTLGVVIFFVAILVSIGLHELGHLFWAKRFGGKVTQYFVGFGPTVWSTRRGETEYGVKAIPLGGYVKIVGMLPPAPEDPTDPEHPERPTDLDAHGEPVVRIRKSNTGLFTQLISDARAAEYELVSTEDSERLFYRLDWWKKVVVMAAGPLVNIAIAFLIYVAVFASYGNPSDVEVAPVISTVAECAIPAADGARDCTAADPKTPAFEAGLQPGDRITSFNETAVTSWSQVQGLIRNNDAGRAVIGFERDGQPMSVTTNTLVTPRPVGDDDAVTAPVGFLGVTPTTSLRHGGPLYTIGQMGVMAKETAQALGTLPAKVFGVGEAVVGLRERDPNGPVSIVGGGRIAGETVSAQDFPLVDKVVFLLSLIAGFNFFVGVFNFVPLLPLDGGHIVSALWEGARRRLARLRGKADPGYVDAAKLLPVAYVVGAALLVMGVVLIIGDLVVPVHLPS